MSQHFQKRILPRRSHRSTSFLARLEFLEERHLLSAVPDTFGVIGDSLTAGNSPMSSWVPIMANPIHGGANFGGAGNPYNVAVGGATSSSIHSGGQVATMQSYVSTGQVDLPYIFIGGNDLLGVAGQIANGMPQATLTNNINTWVGNISTASDTLLNAFPVGSSKELVIVSFPDIMAPPAGQATFDTQVKKDRGRAAIDQANDSLASAAAARHVPFADLDGLQQVMGVGGPLVIGGVTIITTGYSSSDPHYLFQDAIHPGIIGHALLANLMMAAANVGYGTSFDMLNDLDMLNEAGLSASYTGETLSPTVDYTQFVDANPPFSASVAGQQLFYKGSSKWNVTNGATFSDDNAIAPDKTAYLPGSGTSTFSAVSSYDKGITGLMVDLSGTHGTITANDFIFKVGNNNSPNAWTTATAPTTVTTRAGAGTGGSDRIELMWANNAVQKTWLEVIVKGNDTVGGSNTNSGLASSYVFYFGSAIGDSGTGNSGAFQVTSGDEISARSNPKSIGNPATRSDVNDFNRDGLVGSADQIIARTNTTSLGNQLKFLVVGAGGPFAPSSVDSAASKTPTSSARPADFASVATALATPPPHRETTAAAPPPQMSEQPTTERSIEQAADFAIGGSVEDVVKIAADDVEAWMPDDELLSALAVSAQI
jgi:lysophospholipase L1-like esterase